MHKDKKIVTMPAITRDLISFGVENSETIWRYWWNLAVQMAVYLFSRAENAFII